MQKFIDGIINFSLKNKVFTLFWIFLITALGVYSFKKTPIDAYPDVTNTEVMIITQWPGQSTQDVERFVTVPLEVVLNGVQKKVHVRSTTMFGLSVIRVLFEDDVQDDFARQQVANILPTADMPDGVTPQMQPPYTPAGEIYRYLLTSKTKTSSELTILQNWVMDRHLRAVPGVADIADYGGQEKIYEIRVNPDVLENYGITPIKVFEAIEQSNMNVGGDVITKNDQAYVVRGLGLLDKISDIENLVVDNLNGVPILVKNLAEVIQTNKPRVGQVGFNDDDDAVQGIVVMRRGENPTEVIARVEEKMAYLKEKVLPKDVHVEVVYTRQSLIDYASKTVLHNLLEGIVLVTVVVFLFMADWRTTFIVGLVIPLSLMFAFFCLRRMGMGANLLSLGAIDFGIIIDGAVVMVEGIFISLDAVAKKEGMQRFNQIKKMAIIKEAASKNVRAVFFSKLIIITALIPIFSFEKVEGRLFSPLAYTLGFALLGALIFTLTLVPLMCLFLLNKNVKEKDNWVTRNVNKWVNRGFLWTFTHKKISVFVALFSLGLTLLSVRFLGTEFLPQLNEGSLWVNLQFPMSTSLDKSVSSIGVARKKLRDFPEVTSVMSNTGRSNDGTDPAGFYFNQLLINLKSKSEWERKINFDQLVHQMEDTLLSYFPGAELNFSQPVADNVSEAVSGFKGSNGIKVIGADISILEIISDDILERIKKIPGMVDLGIFKSVGQPEVQIHLDEQKMAFYGVKISDVQSVIEMAIGGKTATSMYEGEKKFDVRLRYPYQYRKSVAEIKQLRVPSESLGRVSLSQIATITQEEGATFIYRENNERYTPIKFSVRGRDLGGVISDAKKAVKPMKLAKGYDLEWVGEFKNQVRAMQTLLHVAPISLILIFVLLFASLGNIKDAALVLINVPFSMMGGILGLHFWGINFGISAGIGFIALFGICVQNGVILTTAFKQNMIQGMDTSEAIIKAVRKRTRPVVMTALMASIGLMPAAMATGIGSEAQKPLAVVIISGLFTDTMFNLLVYPVFYYFFYKREVLK